MKSTTTCQVSVAFHPGNVNPSAIAGSNVVVCDILRATTTIIAALRSGARWIIPTPDIPTALRLRREIGPEAILGGERGGVIIDGFQQGNSPLEFTPDVIRNRQLVLCTTNGTVAMESCRSAERVLVGAFSNLSAVAQRLADADRVAVICAGTNGQITSEDVLFAGALVEKLQSSRDKLCSLDDQAEIAAGWWSSAQARMAAGEVSLSEILARGCGGRNLVKLNYHDDICFCAQIDSMPIVPELDLITWRIQLP